MITKHFFIGIFIMIVSASSIAQSTGANSLGWDEGRASIMEDSLNELSEYEPFKSLPMAQLKLFASCLVEKRIQMGKKLGCTWQIPAGVTPQQHFSEQYQCFEEGGYGKAARIEHSAFCMALLEQTY